MSELGRHVEDYLRLRRALGFKMRLHGDVLPQFADYVEAAGAATLTTELAVSFAHSARQGSRNPAARRMVRKHKPQAHDR